MRAAVWTEKDDTEIEYGKLYSSTAKDIRAEEYKVHPHIGKIWAHWSEGVPIKLRRELGSLRFVSENVRHHYRAYYYSLDFVWSRSYTLPELRKNKGLY